MGAPGRKARADGKCALVSTLVAECERLGRPRERGAGTLLAAMDGRRENFLLIERPVEDVFAYLADFENVPHWNYAITRTTKLTPGPLRVGTEYEQRRSIPQPGTEQFTVVAVERPSVLEIDGQIGPFAARLRYELHAVGASRTLLVNEASPSLPGALSVPSPLLARQVGNAMAANLRVLRGLLEPSQPAAPVTQIA